MATSVLFSSLIVVSYFIVRSFDVLYIFSLVVVQDLFLSYICFILPRCCWSFVVLCSLALLLSESSHVLWSAVFLLGIL